MRDFESKPSAMPLGWLINKTMIYAKTHLVM